MNSDTIIRKGEHHIETIVDDEVVLMHVESGRFFSLSGTGRRVWELMVEPTPVGALVDRLTTEFAVDQDTCCREVTELCERLEAGGLIDVGP